MDKIVIIADTQSRPQVALERGIALAAAVDGEVEVLAFCHESLQDLDPGTQHAIKEAILAKKRQWLEELLATADHKNVKLSARVLWQKNIHSAVVELCATSTVDLIVKTGHRSERMLYTPTDWHLLRQTKVPVMICAEKKWKRARPIVAAVDLGTQKASKKRLNDRVINLANRFSQALGVPLHIVCALNVPKVLEDLEIIDVKSYRQKKTAAMKSAVDALCETHGLPREHIHFKSAPPHKVIPSQANALKADLVVIGTVGRSGVKGTIQGNTAEEVLHHLRTDALCVK